MTKRSNDSVPGKEDRVVTSWLLTLWIWKVQNEGLNMKMKIRSSL